MDNDERMCGQLTHCMAVPNCPCNIHCMGRWALPPFDRAHNSITDFNRNHLSILYRFRDIAIQCNLQQVCKHTNICVRCERYVEKRRRTETAKGAVIKPLTVKDINERGQVDLWTCRHWIWIMHYSKFDILRPLKSKTADDVATELYWYSLIPHVLQ